jgi:glucuronokinase
MEERGYGEYERMDVSRMANVYVAYRTSLSEGTEVFHSTLRERWLRGDAAVVGAMETWAGYAAEGRTCLLQSQASGSVPLYLSSQFLVIPCRICPANLA